eukprot:gene12868-12994_t
MLAQPPDQKEAVRQALAPLICCPLLPGPQPAADPSKRRFSLERLLLSLRTFASSVLPRLGGTDQADVGRAQSDQFVFGEAPRQPIVYDRAPSSQSGSGRAASQPIVFGKAPSDQFVFGRVPSGHFVFGKPPMVLTPFRQQIPAHLVILCTSDFFNVQLLLSSEQLKADSEDTVLYTAQRYLIAQPPGQQDAVRQGLAPLIRCPLLCGLQLAAHSGWNCLIQQHRHNQYDEILEQVCRQNHVGSIGFYSVLTPLLSRVRQLAQLQRLPRPLPQLLKAIKRDIGDAPASWHLGQRQSSSILQPEVSVTWKLPIDDLKAACKKCRQLKLSVSLISPDVSAQMGGVAWGLLCKCSWREDIGGVAVCLYAAATYFVKAEVAAFHDFQVEMRAVQRQQRCDTPYPHSLGDGCGFDDAFGVDVMTGDDGWDESAWVSQGLPVEGELDLQLIRMHWVK